MCDLCKLVSVFMRDKLSTYSKLYQLSKRRFLLINGSVEKGSAECGVRSAECGVRSAECGVRSAECGVWKTRSLFTLLRVSSIVDFFSEFYKQMLNACI